MFEIEKSLMSQVRISSAGMYLMYFFIRCIAVKKGLKKLL